MARTESQIKAAIQDAQARREAATEELKALDQELSDLPGLVKDALDRNRRQAEAPNALTRPAAERNRP